MSERIQHDLVQGSPEWHQFRLDHDGASEAAAMLGLSKNTTRSELLRMKHTGVAKEFSDWVQTHILDHGHEAEALARPIAESILGEELYPATYSFGRLSASSDGITMAGDIAWEHKQWNAELAAAVERGELPDEHQPQCHQTIMVTGVEQVLFMVSDGTPENCVHMFVQPNAKWMDRIKAGWAMFHQDLDHYQTVEVIPAAVAAPTMALPALSVQVRGEIQVIDNLKVFGERLNAFIEGLDKSPSTDQAFADAEAAIKTLGTAESALEAAKSSALAQVATVDEMTRTVGLYASQARSTRLMLEKLVKSRKEQIRIEIVNAGTSAFAAHVEMLNKRLGKPYLQMPRPDFGGAIKGKKTVASLRDAVDSMLATSKIEANAQADRAQINLQSLESLAAGYDFLFRDLGALLNMDAEPFDAIVINRVNAHKKAEAERIETEAEKARERIRAEEAAKLQREQLAKEHAAAQVPAQGHVPEPKEAQHPLPAPAAAPSEAQLVLAVAGAFRVTQDQARAWLVDAFGKMAA